MSKLELDLKNSLIDMGFVQPVSSSSKGGKVEVLCRAIYSSDKPWLELVTQILKACEAQGLDALIAKRYLLKNGSLVFGWYLAFESKGAKDLKTKLTAVFKTDFAVPVEAPVQHRPVRVAAPGRHPQKAPPQPRVPQPSGPDPKSNGTPKIRRVSRKIDEDTGRVTEEFEMPLPHVNGSMNVPNARGRGAMKAGSNEVPMILRK